jgi:hypothetical protein
MCCAARRRFFSQPCSQSPTRERDALLINSSFAARGHKGAHSVQAQPPSICRSFFNVARRRSFKARGKYLKKYARPPPKQCHFITRAEIILRPVARKWSITWMELDIFWRARYRERVELFNWCTGTWTFIYIKAISSQTMMGPVNLTAIK